MANSGGCTLLAANGAGVSISAVAQLTIYQNATLFSAPSNQVVQVGDTVVLTVSAGGTQPLGLRMAVQRCGESESMRTGGAGPSTDTQLLQQLYLAVNGQRRELPAQGPLAAWDWSHPVAHRSPLNLSRTAPIQQPIPGA